MSAYRNEVEALRRRLELETKRADEAEEKLEGLAKGREHTWVGDIQLFLARCALLIVPLGILGLLTFYYGCAALFGVFHDSMPLGIIFTGFVIPLLVASPIASYKLGDPSRVGWAFALFSFLYTIFVAPPIGIWGLYVILRPRVRDAVFGDKASEARMRVEVPDVPAEIAPEEEIAEVEVSRTNRSGA